MEEVPETLTIQHTGWLVEGTATVRTFMGFEGVIEMEPSSINCEEVPTKEQIKECINDGGFGGAEIVSAYVTITPMYGAFCGQHIPVDKYLIEYNFDLKCNSLVCLS